MLSRPQADKAMVKNIPDDRKIARGKIINNEDNGFGKEKWKYEKNQVGSSNIRSPRKASIKVYSSSEASRILFQETQKYDDAVELYLTYRGSEQGSRDGDNPYLDEVVMAEKILRFDYNLWNEKLKTVFPLQGSRESEFYVKNKNELGLRVFEVKHNGDRGENVLIPRNQFGVPRGKEFSDYLTPVARKTLFGDSSRRFKDSEVIEAMLSSKDVEKQKSSSGLFSFKKDLIVLPFSGDVDMFGFGINDQARGALQVTNNLLRG